MTRRSLLIVDDDAALLDALPRTIALHADEAGLVDADVETCDDAMRAIDLIEQHDFDVIVTDIKMPGVDGLALLNRISAVRPETPTLLITGHGETELAIQALRGGAYDFIQKPIDRGYFISSLARAVQLRDLRRRVDEQRTALAQYAAELEQRVAARTADLEQAVNAKDEFLGLVSHELRTPITVILGNASILLRRPDYLPTELGASALQDIQVEGERLQRIVENMFVLARVHAGGDLQGVEMEPVMVSRVLPALVARHGERFRDRPLTCDVEPDLPPASAAPVYLELVITNLLSNAEKYSPAGQPIEVAASIDDGEIHVSVRDRGHGINVDEAARVFDAFYRAERLAPTAPGVGIGLTVCKRLVEVQGGRIDVCARQGGGTDVRLWLPVEATAVLEPDTADSMPLAAT